jgi:hypothetical protein
LTRFLVTVVSLVDKKTGKCNQTGLIQTMEYNPCRVSAIMGETYKGYISGGSFHGIGAGFRSHAPGGVGGRSC